MSAVYVAHYGHPRLPGAWHWCLLVPVDARYCRAYQVTGSTTSYTVKEAETIIPESASSFKGKIAVGTIRNDQKGLFETVVMRVPVTNGSKEWNCQDWVVEALGVLKKHGISINLYSKAEMQQMLAAVTPRS